LFQKIDIDETGNGLFNKLASDFLSKIQISIILMGGIRNLEQTYKGLNINYINAITAENILIFIDNSFLETKNFLINKGIPLSVLNVGYFNNLKLYFNEN